MDSSPRHRNDRRWTRRLRPYLRLRSANLFGTFVAAAAAELVGVLLPLVQRQVLDLAIARRVGALWLPLGIVLGLAAMGYWAHRISALRELKSGNDMQYRLYAAVHRRMQKIDGLGGHALSPGQLAARLNSDVGALCRAMAGLPKLAAIALTGVASVVLMLTLNLWLGLVAVLVVGSQALVLLRARHRVGPATAQAQQYEASVAQLANETVGGVRVVKAFGQEQHEIDRMSATSLALFRSRLRIARLEAVFQPLLGSIAVLAQVIVVGVGGWLVLHHELSLGTFLAFSAYAGQLVATVNWLAETTLKLQEAGVSGDRVVDLLDLTPAVFEHPKAQPLPALHGDLCLDRVRFGYTPDRPVLDGFDLRIAAGETVALVGASGSGKSTVVELLARFHDPTLGSVRIDGTDLRGVTLRSIRRQVGVVFEGPFLFAGTIRDNITYGRPDASEAAIVEAARTACAHDFISALPDGYDTAVGERGLTLSGGQRQRIALARTLLTEPPVLVLDDATGAVDVKVEREIFQRLQHGRGHRTTVFVTYRPSTLAVADRIVVVDRGRVVDEGRHQELLDRCEEYRRLIGAAVEPEIDHDYGAVADAASAGRSVPGAPGKHARPEEPDDSFTPWLFVAPHRRALLAALVVLLGQTALGVVGPYLTRAAVDNGILAGSASGLFVAALVLGATSLAGLVLAGVLRMLTGTVGQRLLLELRVHVWAHLVRLPMAYFERQRTGRVLTRMINDLEAFSRLIADGLVKSLVSALTLVGLLVVMVTVSPPLAGLVVVAVLPLVVGLWWLNGPLTVAFTKVRDEMADANAALQEHLAGLREAQAFDQQDRQHAEYTQLTRRFLASRLAVERLVVLSFPLTSFLSGLATAVVLGVGAWMLAAGTLSGGELIAFILWIQLFFAPILQLATFFTDWKRAQESTKRIRSLMREPLDLSRVRTRVPPRQVHGELRLERVRFRYPGAGADALHGINLVVVPGQTVAFVGETGAGKSTIIKLLARFYDPTEGRILMDGLDLRSLEVTRYRAWLGYIPQDPFLFPGSIRDNIAYGRPGASDRAVEAAALAVGAHPVIAGLPGGYGHVVSERGDSLSAGERQLVCLARAYLVDPAVVLLDEGTASLDPAAEARVMRAMRTVARGRTTIMIAHRLQTVVDADRIVVIAGGRIAEQGTHAQLLARGGRYAELWAASSALPVG